MATSSVAAALRVAAATCRPLGSHHDIW